MKRVPFWGWMILGGLILLFIILLFAAPLEKTLGEAIRFVYVHVAFTWAGMLGFYLAGLLGLIIIFNGSGRLQRWTQIITWAALGLFIGGGIFSIFSQMTSWGGVLWEEPRNRTQLTIIALALIALVINSALPWVRIRGALYLALAVFIAVAIPSTPMVFHPENAASNSDSTTIRGAFALLTLVLVFIGAWFVVVSGRSGEIRRPWSERSQMFNFSKKLNFLVR